MPKNIVVCCDGTGNKFCNANTNVIKLFTALDLDDESAQIAYYHPGLGTMGAPGALTQLARWWTKVLGLAFGYGIAGNIGDAYAYLMENFEAGDRVYLFGFSRGAYSVRALASLLHMFGLPRKGNQALIPYLTGMLKQTSPQTFDLAREFKPSFSRECKPYFVGVWDTVSSVGWIMDPLKIPYTAKNPDVAVGRHAISIDERRCSFRQNLWSAAGPGQDLRQVWFAGVHCDVGGGYAEEEGGLSKIALEWMIEESARFGLRFNSARVAEVLARGQGPNSSGVIHESLEKAWLALEIMPRRFWDATVEPPRYRWKLPFGERRRIAADAEIHPSVYERMKAVPGYRPKNLTDHAQGAAAS